MSRAVGCGQPSSQETWVISSSSGIGPCGRSLCPQHHFNSGTLGTSPNHRACLRPRGDRTNLCEDLCGGQSQHCPSRRDPKSSTSRLWGLPTSRQLGKFSAWVMAAALPEPPDLGAWEAAARLASLGWGVGHGGDGRRRPGRPAPETCSSPACDSDVGQGHREAPVSHMAFVPRGPPLCLPADTHLLMHKSVPTVEEKPPRAWGETFLRPSRPDPRAS